MPFRSQRNVAFSDGDAAVLIRAMNRQRADDAAEAPRRHPLVESGIGHPDPIDRIAGESGGERRNRRSRCRPIDASGEGPRPVERVPRTDRPGPEPVARLVGREEGGDDVRRPRRRRRGEARAVGSDRRDAGRDSRTRRDRSGGHGARAGLLQGLASWFTSFSPRTYRRLAIALGVVAIVAFFYGPTADLYAAARDHDQLVAKVEATNAIADDLRAEIERLQTEEGVMDEARVRGYANPDEVAVDASELLGIEETVKVPELSKPIETEEPPLYIQALDVLMGYEEHV